MERMLKILVGAGVDAVEAARAVVVISLGGTVDEAYEAMRVPALDAELLLAARERGLGEVHRDGEECR